jgi:hypothetical protein
VNDLHRKKGLGLALCCRTASFNEMNVKASLGFAVELQPLKSDQLNEVLSRYPDFWRVRESLISDPDLRDVLTTPFMLNIASTALQHSSDAVARASSPTVLRRVLIGRFCDVVYRSRIAPRYSRQQVWRWLKWLAGIQSVAGGVVFYLEDIVWIWERPSPLRRHLALSIFAVAVTAPLYLNRVIVDPVITNMLQHRSALSIGATFIGLFLNLLIGAFVMINANSFIGKNNRLVPNEGIRSAIWSSMAWLQIVFLISYVEAMLYPGGFHSEISAGMRIFAVVSTLVLGGWQMIAHFTVRIMLALARVMPVQYVRFLDAMANAALLRKVGGGYIFTHRLLLEYFLSGESPGVRSPSAEAPQTRP